MGVVESKAVELQGRDQSIGRIHVCHRLVPYHSVRNINEESFKVECTKLNMVLATGFGEERERKKAQGTFASHCNVIQDKLEALCDFFRPPSAFYA